MAKPSEPDERLEGDAAIDQGGIFVVHKHDASRLHYDFRLEHGGMLWSWAVTRGPSLDPAEKRLAVRVEDHQLDYATFEGVIAEGAYGAGAVIVWDEGRWTPQGDPAEGMARGRLSFRLEGRKLRGGWHLVRMRARKTEKRENWLLVKDDDAEARAEGDILADAPASVRTGRTVEALAGKPAASVDGAAKTKKATASHRRRKTESLSKGLVEITHPDKLLWEEAGVSKGDLLAHYEAAWERMAPFLRNRPLTLVRAPDGKKRFFQQHSWAGMPSSIATIVDPSDRAELLFVQSFEGLKGLVQFGAVEIHGWGATVADLKQPDQATFDLDPDEGLEADRLRSAALEIRERLEAAGHSAFVKTSSSKGFHIVAPLVPGAGWERLADFVRGLAQGMAEDDPARYTVSAEKAERKGRIYIDTLRNHPNATTVLPWSSRAKPSAAVSVPMTWAMLEDGVGPADFTLKSDALRAALHREDPWKDFRKSARPLSD